ncbi:MAG: hypothetical protein KJZ93_05035, partial [Caldilineaceae bacterium]|nr:hypothetical protein [Caldilineaceae bacterium]
MLVVTCYFSLLTRHPCDVRQPIAYMDTVQAPHHDDDAGLVGARFAHNLALNWNIGEENTQSSDEIRDMAKFLHDTDPYRHHIVLHTFPPQQYEVYSPLLGD